MDNSLHINQRVSIIAHPGQRAVILVGEDSNAIAMTPEIARQVGENLIKLATLADSPSDGSGEDKDAPLDLLYPYKPAKPVLLGLLRGRKN